MEMNFDKSAILYQHCILRDCQCLELTQDLKVSDGMPDIGTVLSCWGQCVLRTKEWRTESIGVTGGVMVWVLYLPEGGGAAQCMEAWIPFQMKWNIPKTPHDGSISAVPYLYSADARSLSAKKLMLRVNIGILAEAWCATQKELSMPTEWPEDIQLLKNTYPMRIVKEVGEKHFEIEESLEMSTAEPGVDKILRFSIQPQVLESKLMGDKVVFRGIAIVHILYSSEDGQLYSRDFDVPFSQYADLDGEYSGEGDTRVCLAVTAMEMEKEPDGGLNVKAGLVGQYRIFEDTSLCVSQDAYSNQRALDLHTELLDLPNILDSSHCVIHAESDVGADVRRCVDVALMVRQPQSHYADEQSDADLRGTFRVLYYDPEGELASTSVDWNGAHTVLADRNCQVYFELTPVGKSYMNPSNGSVQGDVYLETQVSGGEPIQILNGISAGQYTEPDPKRPSLILRRAGNESLWELAKATGSTVALIQNANRLDGVLEKDRMLLIPIP